MVYKLEFSSDFKEVAGGYCRTYAPAEPSREAVAEPGQRGVLESETPFDGSSFTCKNFQQEVPKWMQGSAGLEELAQQPKDFECVVQKDGIPFGGLNVDNNQYKAGSDDNEITGEVPSWWVSDLNDYLTGTSHSFYVGDWVKVNGEAAKVTRVCDDPNKYGVTKVEGDADERIVASSQIEVKPTEFHMRVPSCQTRGRFILEQEYVTGDSLEKLMKHAKELGDENSDQFTRYMLAQRVGPSIDGAFDAYTLGFVPMLGCMLMHEGIGHADPHAGNLIYNTEDKILWVIDWGATVNLDSDEKRGLAGLVRQTALSELHPSAASVGDVYPSRQALNAQGVPKLQEAERAFLDTNLAEVQQSIDFWRYIFHPGKYDAPEGMDLDGLKKGLKKASVVLCLETCVLTSRLLKESEERIRSLDPAQASQYITLRAPTSLLGLWDDAVDLPPMEKKQSDATIDAVHDDSTTLSVIPERASAASLEADIAKEVRIASVQRSSTMPDLERPRSASSQEDSADSDAKKKPKYARGRSIMELGQDKVAAEEDRAAFRGTRVAPHHAPVPEEGDEKV